MQIPQYFSPALKKLVKDNVSFTLTSAQAKFFKKLWQGSNAQTSLGYGKFTTRGLGYVDNERSTCYVISEEIHAADEITKEDDHL